MPISSANIAVYNASSTALMALPGGDLSDSVSSLAVASGNMSDTLYAAGPFTQAGSSPVNSIAQWNLGQWSALGSGLQNNFREVSQVQVEVTASGNIIAGGVFDRAGAVPVYNMALWNGVQQRWSSIGDEEAFAEFRMFPFALSGDDIFITAQTFLSNILAPVFGDVDFGMGLPLPFSLLV